MPRLPAKQREAEKVSTQLPGGLYAAAAHDTPPRHAFEVSCLLIDLVHLFSWNLLSAINLHSFNHRAFNTSGPRNFSII